MESRVTKLVEDVVRMEAGGRAGWIPLLISAVCGCRKGGELARDIFRSPPFVRHRSQFMVLGLGLGGAGGLTHAHAQGRRGHRRSHRVKAGLSFATRYNGSALASP